MSEFVSDVFKDRYPNITTSIYDEITDPNEFVEKTNPDIVCLSNIFDGPEKTPTITGRDLFNPDKNAEFNEKHKKWKLMSLRIIDAYQKKNKNTVFINLWGICDHKLIDAYFERQIFSFNSIPARLDVLDGAFFSNADKGHMYILIGPSGSGKSTLKKQLTMESMIPVTKITTRGYRSMSEVKGIDIESVSKDLFNKLNLSENLEAAHNYRDFKYGFSKEFMDESLKGGRDYIFDTCDIAAALKLKSKYPETIRTMLVLPNIHEGKKRFINRERQIEDSRRFQKDFDGSKLSVEYLINQTLEDMHYRGKCLEAEYRYFDSISPFVDIDLYDQYEGKFSDVIKDIRLPNTDQIKSNHNQVYSALDNHKKKKLLLENMDELEMKSENMEILRNSSYYDI